MDELHEIKPLRLTVRVSNNILRQMRMKNGLSAPAFAASVGVKYGTYISLENMKETARGMRGWTPTAMKIADHYRVPPELLFPDDVLSVRKSRVEITASASDVRLFASGHSPASPDMALEARETLELVRSTLSTKWASMFLAHVDGATYDEIGEEHGISRSRAGQLVDASKRRLAKVIDG